MAPRFLIRADASRHLGSGHVMRCLTLARALREQGAQVAFACRPLAGNLMDSIAAAGFPVHSIGDAGPPGDDGPNLADDARDTAAVLAAWARESGAVVDGLIVDHYALDEIWEAALAPRVGRILAIDDRPGRRHRVQVLLDPNPSLAGAGRWHGWVPADCRVLAGPRFALLRQEFLAARTNLRTRDGRVRRLLVSFGGSDPEGAGLLALAALERLAGQGWLDDVLCDVVAGSANPHSDALRQATSRLPDALFSISVDDMAARMAAADLALGAGGGSLWERCYLGLPALVLVIADNQAEATDAAARQGAAWNLGRPADWDAERLAARLAAALSDPAALCQAGARGSALMGEPDFIHHPLDWLT